MEEQTHLENLTDMVVAVAVLELLVVRPQVVQQVQVVLDHRLQ